MTNRVFFGNLVKATNLFYKAAIWESEKDPSEWKGCSICGGEKNPYADDDFVCWTCKQLGKDEITEETVEDDIDFDDIFSSNEHPRKRIFRVDDKDIGDGLTLDIVSLGGGGVEVNHLDDCKADRTGINIKGDKDLIEKIRESLENGALKDKWRQYAGKHSRGVSTDYNPFTKKSKVRFVLTEIGPGKSKQVKDLVTDIKAVIKE